MSLCCLALFMTLYLLERVPRPTKGELRWGWQNLLWIRSCHIRSPIPHLRNRLINIGSQYHAQIFTCFRCKNTLQSIEISNFRDFFKCHPAKYTALLVQHTRTQKYRFSCLIFCARISNLPLKYGKASITTW